MSDRPVIGQRLKEFQQREVERILGACTQCGKCFEVCPMAQYSKAPATDGSYTFDHLASVLLLDDRGTLTGTITFDEDPAVALAKIKRLVGIAVS